MAVVYVITVFFVIVQNPQGAYLAYKMISLTAEVLFDHTTHRSSVKRHHKWPKMSTSITINKYYGT